MKTTLAGLTLVVLLVAAELRSESQSGSASGQPTLAGQAQVGHCQVLLKRDIDIPAEESGRLVAVTVEEGQDVSAGMLLMQIDDRQAQLDRLAAELERDAAQTQASDDIEVKYAIKSHELADAELTQSLEINRRSPGAVPTSEMRRQQLAKHRAELQIDRSRLDQQVAQMTANVREAAVQAADENILRRQIKAPFNGTVIEVLQNENEWVNAGQSVLRLVQLDELYVDGFLSSAALDSSEIAGCDVTVEVELARGRSVRFRGQIVFVNPLIQAGSKFRARALVSNRKENGHWLLRPGMMASMVVHGRSGKVGRWEGAKVTPGAGFRSGANRR